MPVTLVVATRNRHKLQEIRSILGPSVSCVGLQTIRAAPELVEDAETFAGNAIKKAVQLAEWLASHPEALAQTDPALLQPASALFVLADDSGLEVDALGGAPGVHSARFAALDSASPTNSSDAANNQKVLQLLRDVPSESRTARFRCVLAFTPARSSVPEVESPVCFANEFELSTELFEGYCEGHLAFQPRGTHGFGYDPLFIPSGYQESLAELGEETKDRISHRAKALEKLKRRLESARGGPTAAPLKPQPPGTAPTRTPAGIALPPNRGRTRRNHR